MRSSCYCIVNDVLHQIVFFQRVSKTGSQGHIGLNNGEPLGDDNDSRELVHHEDVEHDVEEHKQEEVHLVAVACIFYIY